MHANNGNNSALVKSMAGRHSSSVNGTLQFGNGSSAANQVVSPSNNFFGEQCGSSGVPHNRMHQSSVLSFD